MVSKGQLQRALRLLQAMFSEGERRGYPVEVSADRGQCAGGAGLRIRGEVHELVVVEERRREATDPNRKRRPYEYVPPHELVPTGRLRLDLGHGSFVGPLATDRRRWRIEDRLGHAFQRLERCAEDIEARRLEREAREAERAARLLEQLRADEQRQAERARVDHLIGQVQAWRLAADMREFVQAARGTGHGPESPATADWLTWAEEVAGRIDPIQTGTFGPPDG